MILQQRRFPRIRCSFELTETALLVAGSNLLRSNRVEVPLKELRAIPSYFKQLPLPSLMFAGVFSLGALGALGGAFQPSPGEERMGLLAVAAAVAFLAACCWLRFFTRKVDYVIFHGRHTGRPVVFINQGLPSARHVEEFVAILREKIEQAALT